MFKESHLGGITVLALDPTLAVELEAIRALVEPVELWRRWVTRHRHTSSLLPAAILGALSLEGSSSRKRHKKRQLRDPVARPMLSQTPECLWSQLSCPCPTLAPWPVPLGAGELVQALQKTYHGTPPTGASKRFRLGVREEGNRIQALLALVLSLTSRVL